MKTIRTLAALLLALCLLTGLCACDVSSKDVAAAVQLVTEVMEELDAAEESPAAENGESDAVLQEVPPETEAPVETEAEEPAEETPTLDPDGVYTSRDDVALYLHLYGELPQNFITKSEARELGWSSGGLDGYADGMCIGGDRFGNYEGILPDGSYHECDIDTLHASSRGAKRIVYADDGRIYYTDDHYESFTLLYGEE